MLSKIQKFLSEHVVSKVETQRPEALHVATAALLIEISRADHQVSVSEHRAIRDGLQQIFTISEAQLDQIIELAQQQATESTCYYHFASTINQTLDASAKLAIVDALWQVAAADGHLDRYEEYYLRKIADLLHVPHSDFIRSKHRVLA